MTDQVFGELDFDGYYWNGHVRLDWFGEEREVGLMIDSCHESQNEISDRQRETYRTFLEWRMFTTDSAACIRSSTASGPRRTSTITEWASGC